LQTHGPEAKTGKCNAAHLFCIVSITEKEWVVFGDVLNLGYRMDVLPHGLRKFFIPFGFTLHLFFNQTATGRQG
jgi:hypothetical protein